MLADGVEGPGQKATIRGEMEYRLSLHPEYTNGTKVTKESYMAFPQADYLAECMPTQPGQTRLQAAP